MPRQRRSRIWARQQEIVNFPGDQAFSLLADFRAVANTDQPYGSTVARIRGTGQVLYGEGPFATADAGITMGILVEERGQAAADLPRPTVTPHVDWMFWRYFPVYEADVGDPAAADSYGFEFDVKSMRKMDELQLDLWCVIDVVGPAGSLFIATSTLLLLP